METTSSAHSADQPGRDAPRRGETAPPDDVLSAVTNRLAVYDASPEARTLLAQILAATLAAFTHTSSVRDPLPDTAPGTATEALAVLAGIDHLRSSLSAVDAAWQVTAEQRIRRDDQERGVPTSEQGRGAAHEIGLARRVSPASSSFSLASARRLVQQMPGTVESLWASSLTQQQASTVASTLDGAGPATCAQIDQLIVEHPEMLQGKGHKALRSDLQKMIQRLEPETSRERAERAARARHVTMTPLADGMAHVTAVLRGIDAAGMMQILHKKAESLRAAGARDSVPALEADLLVDAVRGSGAPDGGNEGDSPTRRPRTTPGLDVGIVITDTALLGRGDDTECAELEGYGALPAHIVTDTLRGSPPGHLRPPEDEHPDHDVTAFYRRLYASPGTGDLIAMESTARIFPTGLARMIRWRDVTCRTPWCNATIRQIDHAVPHHRGGPTSYDNGQGLCVRCNLLKELGLWVLTPLSRTDVEGDHAARAGDVAPGSEAPQRHSPPAGWGWRSPHGAIGSSRTRPLLGPRERQGPTNGPPDPKDSSLGTSDPRSSPPGTPPP